MATVAGFASVEPTNILFSFCWNRDRRRLTCASLPVKQMIMLNWAPWCRKCGAETRKVVPVRNRAHRPFNAAPATALVQAVRDAHDGGTVADVIKRAGYTGRSFCPALVDRGLLEQQRALLFFRRWKLTAAGAAEQRRIERKIARAHTIPALLHSDPAEAAAIALAVGSTLLLVEELRPLCRQLVEAMRAKAVASGAGGLPPDYWPCGDAHRHHDDQHPGDAGQPGDNVSVHDGGTGNPGSVDLGALAVEALGALDAATFDASFDASAGGGGDGGSSGDGNGGGSASGGGD
jgi:hypothetical protein